jgi:hypothetical protein
LTLPLVVLASILWFLALVLLGAASNADYLEGHQEHVVKAQFWLATVGLIGAWLARIWSRQGHARHATAAAALAVALFIAAIVVLVAA